MKKNNFIFIFGVILLFCFSTLSFADPSSVISRSAPDQFASIVVPVNNDNHESYARPIVLLSQVEKTSSFSDDELDDEEMDDLEDDFDNTIEMTSSVSDPIYYFNYAMFQINDVFYLGVLEPIAGGYKAIVPTPVRTSVNHFFHNLLFPVRFVNNLLQGEIEDAGNEVGIFVINSTAGVLGLFQVAQNNFDLQTADEDLGQTFGSYDIGNGFYLVLPLLGPSTLRDTIGLVGDSFLKPVGYIEPWELSLGIRAYDTINSTSFRIGDYQTLKEAAIDPYLAIRDAYIQNRNKKIKE